eukprot:SM000293S10917  [mRNA]  locus=s293:5370:8550:+ [translate_table: standard]
MAAPASSQCAAGRPRLQILARPPLPLLPLPPPTRLQPGASPCRRRSAAAASQWARRQSSDAATSGSSLMRSSPAMAASRKPISRWRLAATDQQAEDGHAAAVLGELDCVGTGVNVECVATWGDGAAAATSEGDGEALAVPESASPAPAPSALGAALDLALLISPFFFWGTAMVAMKGVLPKAGPLFVASTRLIPAGALLIGFAASRGRPQPKTAAAWLAITLFALVDGTCFQGFLAEGLRRTTAGLGSVIIDSQPLTVAVLATIFFGETLSLVGVAGLVLGVVGLCLLEVPREAFAQALSPDGALRGVQGVLSGAWSGGGSSNGGSVWGSGEFYMLLAAQSMAVGTVMVRWVCRHVDPIMATGWHMVVGGLPLLALSVLAHDPALNGHLGDLGLQDNAALVYTSVFGSAVSYGVFFYNANRGTLHSPALDKHQLDQSAGNLTRLSSLTFLTPMFAALFGFVFLGETLDEWQLLGATVTLSSIYLVNYKQDDKMHTSD